MPVNGNEWSHRTKHVEQPAGRVLQQGGSPLSERQREALLSRLRSKPVYLLGSTTGYARDFIQTAARLFPVRGVVDDLSRESDFGGVPRVSSEEFAARGAGSIAVCLAFSHRGLEYFKQL